MLVKLSNIQIFDGDIFSALTLTLNQDPQTFPHGKRGEVRPALRCTRASPIRSAPHYLKASSALPNPLLFGKNITILISQHYYHVIYYLILLLRRSSDIRTVSPKRDTTRGRLWQHWHDCIHRIRLQHCFWEYRLEPPTRLHCNTAPI